MEGKRTVCILTHGFFADARTRHREGGQITFQETLVVHPEANVEDPANPPALVHLGVATVDEDAWVELYESHPCYVEIPASHLPPHQVLQDLNARRLAAGVSGDPPSFPDDEGEGEPAKAADEDEGKPIEGREENPLAGVNFDNDNAGELAAALGLIKSDFAGVNPTGKSGGYLTKDVREIAAAREKK